MALFTRTKAVVAAVAVAVTAGVWWAAAHGQLTKIAATIENIVRSERAKPAEARRIPEAELSSWEASLRKWAVEWNRIKELGNEGLKLLTKRETQSEGLESIKSARILAIRLVKEAREAAATATDPKAKAAFTAYAKTLENNMQRLAAEAARARQAPEASDLAAVAKISEWVHFVETDLRRIGSEVRDILNKTNSRLDYERVAVKANQALGRAQALRKRMGSKQRTKEMDRHIARLTAAVKEANNGAAHETRRINEYNERIQTMIRDVNVSLKTASGLAFPRGRRPNYRKALAHARRAEVRLASEEKWARGRFGNRYHLFRPYHDALLVKANKTTRNIRAAVQKIRAARARR